MRTFWLATIVVACFFIGHGCQEEQNKDTTAAKLVWWRQVQAAYGHWYVIVQQPEVYPATCRGEVELDHLNTRWGDIHGGESRDYFSH